jgi:taurine---2-oxoglutarate transaminase
LLISDEVMSGFGRTGEWFAVDNWDVEPDIMTIAKGLTSGYMPMGGVVVSDDIARHFDERMLYMGLTYFGHPLSAAAAVATLQVYQEEDWWRTANAWDRCWLPACKNSKRSRAWETCARSACSL